MNCFCKIFKNQQNDNKNLEVNLIIISKHIMFYNRKSFLYFLYHGLYVVFQN